LGFFASIRRTHFVNPEWIPPQSPLSELATTIKVFLSSPSIDLVSAFSNTVFDVCPYFRDSVMARCARVSLVEATIFIVFVIFSMLRIDFSRSSISRRVAKVAALGATGLFNHEISTSSLMREASKALRSFGVVVESCMPGGSYRADDTAPALKAGRAALESILGDRKKDVGPAVIGAQLTTTALETN
jgi:hypothetical protein